jgi:hypothetical protein
MHRLLLVLLLHRDHSLTLPHKRRLSEGHADGGLRRGGWQPFLFRQRGFTVVVVTAAVPRVHHALLTRACTWACYA